MYTRSEKQFVADVSTAQGTHTELGLQSRAPALFHMDRCLMATSQRDESRQTWKPIQTKATFSKTRSALTAPEVPRLHPTRCSTFHRPGTEPGLTHSRQVLYHRTTPSPCITFSLSFWFCGTNFPSRLVYTARLCRVTVGKASSYSLAWLPQWTNSSHQVGIELGVVFITQTLVVFLGEKHERLSDPRPPSSLRS